MNDDDFSIFIPVPRARLENRVPHEHTAKDWRAKQARYNWRCAYCGIHKDKTPEKYLTRDHVYPIFYGGRDTIENIVPACKTCNKRKGRAFIGALDKRGHTIPEPRARKRVQPW